MKNYKCVSDISKSDIEDFIVEESYLIDSWKLEEWYSLFSTGGSYLVPSTDIDYNSSPAENLFYIADDYFRLGERVKRLLKRNAHSEFPRSKVLHQNTNFRIISSDLDTLYASCNFLIHRTKIDTVKCFYGTAYYKFNVDGGEIKIKEKRLAMATEGLRKQGRISIIL
ncbi:p-cumate dioxygenase small subunit (CmtAc) [gamma proteobacterium BDW918]|uniref:Uncharacterized protein n=1 Tax=Zhongshania aliphaticivorans TaxID=1470434 RepID=A0A127M9X4_9GAMM|nr:aromatic-ring-hydroxylating dioxygenase subunit beta [Zhongshania aliphaticivorans]AMO70051.1 hypothetical protein AZF00_17855 [Zhongshania aliphaticivorans]EIF41733.1 p-cumate dioxygenase small subunit (CmtAc) [gamma proteobacterium BDW918]|tara:strand:- start:58882 stop:59385 length:504 start_codon:yes stop_codon:yes gene_type:complete